MTYLLPQYGFPGAVDWTVTIKISTGGHAMKQIVLWGQCMATLTTVLNFFVPERLSFVRNDYCVADNECAFPHSCVVRPKDAQGKGFTVLDKNG